MKKIFLLVTSFLFLFIVSCIDQPTMIENNQTEDVGSLAKSNSYTFADDYIVEYTNEAKFLKAVSSIGGKVKYNHSAINFASVTNLDGKKANKLSKMSGIKNVTQDLILQWVNPKVAISQEHIGSNESFWGYQWGPVAISAPEAWDAGYTGGGVRVAVIDGGMSANHEDLKDNIDASASQSFVSGLEWYEDKSDFGPEAPFRHATHVAGIIAAEDNGIGTIGIAPHATIISLKALDDGEGTFAAINAAIIYAADVANADIINMSLGAYVPKNAPGVAQLKNYQNAAITYAYQKGVTVIVSAGNDAIDFDHVGPWISLPSDASHAINVSATAPTGFAYGGDDYDTPASYTNYGQSFIDFAAPGGDFDYPGSYWWYDMVFSPGAGVSDYYWAAGTSMAAPHVAGVAALIIEKNGGPMKPAQVEAALRASADDLGKPGNDDYYGAGRVNAYRAVMQ